MAAPHRPHRGVATGRLDKQIDIGIVDLNGNASRKSAGHAVDQNSARRECRLVNIAACIDRGCIGGKGKRKGRVHKALRGRGIERDEVPRRVPRERNGKRDRGAQTCDQHPGDGQIIRVHPAARTPLMGKYELAQVSWFRDQGTNIRNRKIRT
jgi:hypothetical protein